MLMLLPLALLVQPPLASAPKVEVSGKIEKVQISMGQGMPYLDVKTKDGTRKVWLGSMRYLMEQNFNPKAGDEIQVSGYAQNEGILASKVTLPGRKTTLLLRDERGFPLWRGGGYGKRQK
jgi:hypothetical protein